MMAAGQRPEKWPRPTFASLVALRASSRTLASQIAEIDAACGFAAARSRQRTQSLTFAYTFGTLLLSSTAGVRATGIGCYFDDPVHRVFGLEDLAFQSLYHFAVGGVVDDPRLTTLAPYGIDADVQGHGIDLR